MVLLEFKSLGSSKPNKGHIDAVATKKHPRTPQEASVENGTIYIPQLLKLFQLAVLFT